jgi:hypothetical protein
MDVSEKHHNIASGFAFDVDAAKEADCVVNRGTGRDVNVREELDLILLRTRGDRRKGCAEKENRKDVADHRQLHSPRLREMGGKSSGRELRMRFCQSGTHGNSPEQPGIGDQQWRIS